MTEYARPSVVVPVYGTTVQLDMGLSGKADSSIFSLTVTDGVAFAIANPLNARAGQELTLMILNGSGGAMGAVTFGTGYRLAGAFANPANTKRQVIRFFSLDGVAWYEIARTVADLAI